MKYEELLEIIEIALKDELLAKVERVEQGVKITFYEEQFLFELKR